MRQHFALNLWPGGELRGLQVITCLQVQPELRRGIEIPRQPQCSVRRDASLFANNIVDARRGNAQRNRQRVCGQAKRHHEFFAENFAGMNGSHLVHLSRLNGSQQSQHLRGRSCPNKNKFATGR